MDVNERIKEVGKYFTVFNVHDGAVCVGVVFPEKWTLFDVETICNEFGIQIQVKDKTTFFLCDIADGFDPVFDAVDFIIKQNRSLEQKTELLREKVGELQKLFEKEPLERLQTLHFVFDDTIKQVKDVTLPIDIKKELKNSAKKTVQKQQTNETSQTNNSVSEEKPIEQAKPRKQKKSNNDSPLMNFVKNALEDE